MESVHLSVAGTIIAFSLIAAIGSLIRWMLSVPEVTPTTLRVARAIRLTQHANRILVAVQGKALSDRLVALGSQMAKARQATVELFYVIEVPWTLPLSASLPDSDAMARDELDRAQRIADRYGVRLDKRIVNVREAGPAIIREAVATNADIILMSDLPTRPGGTRFSQTTAYVFTHAPTEVLLDRPASPEEGFAEARSA
jgi:nucleotide-binding universal stress UspA family protein